jgi:hypothetical protein
MSNRDLPASMPPWIMRAPNASAFITIRPREESVMLAIPLSLQSSLFARR